MDSVSLVSQTPFCLKEIQDMLSKRWHVEIAHYGRLVVEGQSTRAYLYHVSPDVTVDGFQLLIDYSDIELIKSILETIADNPNVIVDNGFDLVIPGNEFAALIRARKDWDWRRE